DMSPVTAAATVVGRDGELALLDGLLREAARGRGAAVLIEGEPGIGKSTLVHAAVAADVGCQVFWGAGDELGMALPLLPFLDALRVREPSVNARRNTIVGLLRGEIAADRGADVPATLDEQLLALIEHKSGLPARALRGRKHRPSGRPSHRRPAVGRSGQRRPLGTAGEDGALRATVAYRDGAPGAAPG